jgi:hypothetical protein
MIPDRQRTTRLASSAITLALIGTIVSVIGNSLNINLFVCISLFVGYLLIAASLMTVLAGRLFRQHGLRKLKFDISAMLILTTLIALPLGFSSAFQYLGENVTANISPEERNTVLTVVVSSLLYFSLFPILFAAEATLVWFSRWRNRNEKK